MSVGGLLVVRHNSSLTNVDGLSNLTWAGGDVVIDDNGSLMDVNGLSSLTSITGTLFITSNALKNVDGLSGITSVAADLGITNNGLLTNVDGLSGLRSVGGNLRFSGDFSLTNLDGVSGLETVGGSLMILSNFELTEFCGLYRLLAGDGLGGNYEVSSNGENPSVQDILDEGPCDPADTIGELLAEGAINEGMAMALLQLADNSLEGLAGILTGFVQGGILTPSESQLLLAIASSWVTFDNALSTQSSRK